MVRLRQIIILCAVVILITAHSAIAVSPLRDIPASDAPIEIQADALEVQPHNGVAIFHDNVVVDQEGMQLKAARMDVHYMENEQQKSERASKTTPQGEITLIEAQGGVVITVPGRKARSDMALYDIKKGIVQLYGNVQMEEEGTVLTGERFIYDVISGKSRLETVTNNKKAPTGSEENTSSGRVKIKIRPKQRNTTLDGVNVP